MQIGKAIRDEQVQHRASEATKMNYLYIMKYFEYSHLPEHLRIVSAPFGQLATKIYSRCPTHPETYECLRKLLEAKDCAVRAMLLKDTEREGG